MKKDTLISILLLISVTVTSGAKSQLPGDSIVDGIVAIVGGNIILKSDLEMQYIQFRSQGNITGSPERIKCQILEDLLLQKLVLHQAEVDSIKVTDVMVENEMDRRMRYFIAQAGSPERLEEYYQKTILEIKNEMREIIREQMMVEQEQQKITDNISITPSEVKAWFRKLDKDSIPLINTELEIGLIALQPSIGEEEKQIVRDKLKVFRDRIKKGDDFATLAVLYSEDPGSAKQGGELGMFKRGDMLPEFEAAAFKLKPGEVSDVVETEDGFHIIQMIERRGEYVNVRHILLQPQVSPVNLARSKVFLDSVASLITQKKITFDDAVVKFSDDPSKNNGGMMINNVTGNTRFESGQLDAKIFFIVDKLKVGEISAPVLTRTDKGKHEYRIYYLKERTDPHRASLEEDYARIQQMALANKKITIIDEWIADHMGTSFIHITEEYNGCAFQHHWIKD